MDHKKTIFLLTFIVIVFTEDTLLFGTNMNNLFMVGRFIFYIILLLFFFNSTWRHINKLVIIPTLLIIASFLTVMLLNNDFRNGYILQLLSIFIALKIANTIKFHEFIEYFSKIIYFLSIASICLFVLINAFPTAINLLPTITNIGDVQFGTILVSNIMKLDGVLRNSSIFREPGVYGIYLIICLLYHFFVASSLNLKRIIVFFIALLTTFSTTAFFALILIIIGYILQGRNIKAKVYISVGTAIFIIFLLPLISEIVFSKLNENTAEYRSTLSRIASFTIPLSIFKDHPLGVGLSKFVDLYPSYSSRLYGLIFRSDGEATNTFINTFAIYGVIYGLILIYAIWRLACLYMKSALVTFIIFSIYILIFSSQELRFSLLFNLLIMYSFIYRKPKDLPNTINTIDSTVYQI